MRAWSGRVLRGNASSLVGERDFSSFKEQEKGLTDALTDRCTFGSYVMYRGNLKWEFRLYLLTASTISLCALRAVLRDRDVRYNSSLAAWNSARTSWHCVDVSLCSALPLSTFPGSRFRGKRCLRPFTALLRWTWGIRDCIWGLRGVSAKHSACSETPFKCIVNWRECFSRVLNSSVRLRCSKLYVSNISRIWLWREK